MYNHKLQELCYEQNTAQRDWREHSKFLAKNYARSANSITFVIC